MIWYFFFFNDTATTEIYTLSLHDALPISRGLRRLPAAQDRGRGGAAADPHRARHRLRPQGELTWARPARRSEEHTSELQSRQYLVCRLLLEKKKNNTRCNSQHVPTTTTLA